MKYTTVLNQLGVQNPSSSELQNDFPGSITWERVGVGKYLATLDSDVEYFTGDFTAACLLGNIRGITNDSVFCCGRLEPGPTVNTLTLSTYRLVNGSLVLADDILVGTAISVESVQTA